MKKRGLVILAMALLITGCGSEERSSNATPYFVEEEAQSDADVMEEAQVLEEAEDTAEVTESEKNGYVVAIDPGHQLHGNNSQEAIGPGSTKTKPKVAGGTHGTTTGKKEYELTLEVSLLLRDELEARGYTVYMTRETHEVDISNQERAAIANEAGADICIRIHADGNDSSSAHGASVLVPSSTNKYVSNLADDSARLGHAVVDSYCTATGLRNRGVITSDTMTGINFATMPVIILEMGFMTNPSDDTYMAAADSQSVMAAGIADGVDEYFSQIDTDSSQ